jgi:A/G-specific adenine glycosylase
VSAVPTTPVVPPTPVPAEAAVAILAWYAGVARPLAFRRTRDPYAILVSEAMAQQTQAARAAEHWERFMARFPTVDALAAASPADVLRAWAGLGYDRRALALWRTARVIVEEHGGRVPATVAQLVALPVVGPYTARAVAALAYGVPVGAVDTNVRRVLGRMRAGAPDALSARELQVLADASVPADDPGGWTHALMDLGATVCKPRAPSCEACPARPWCIAANRGRGGVATDLGHAGRAHPRPTTPFPATNRWLRGRILDRLRAAPDGAWVVLDGPIGDHPAERVASAAAGLARDGVIELDATAPTEPRARLPMA